ncbi:MAG: hypothetical protein EPN73_23810 [Paraburkholderia sp.]|nr:MAG: hypothetical protein EPN73_23810 [Paraburkholderia sp.]
MLRRLVVKLRCRCVMFCRGFAGCASAGRGRCYRRRRAGVVRASVVGLIDRVQRVAMGDQRLVGGVGKVMTPLEKPRRRAVIPGGLLVMRRRGFEMSFLAVLRAHTGSRQTEGPTPMATGSTTQWRVANHWVRIYTHLRAR